MDTLVMPAPTHSAVSTSSRNQETMTRKRKKLNATEHSNFVEPRILSTNKGTEDEHSVFGQIVAVTLRKLTRDMLICCKKIMNDAMFEAEMGTLTKYSKIISEPRVPNTERLFRDAPVQNLANFNAASIQDQTTVRAPPAPPQRNKPVSGNSKASVASDEVTKKSKTLNTSNSGSNKDTSHKDLEISSAWSKSDCNNSCQTDETETLALEVIKEFSFSDFGEKTSLVSSTEMRPSILPDAHKSCSNSAAQLKVEPEWNNGEGGADEVILDSMDSSSETFDQETESLDSALVGEDQGTKTSQKTLDVPSVTSSHFQGELIVGLPMSQASKAGGTSGQCQEISISSVQSMHVGNELGINRARLDTSNDEDSDSYYIYEEPSTRIPEMEQGTNVTEKINEKKERISHFLAQNVNTKWPLGNLNRSTTEFVEHVFSPESNALGIPTNNNWPVAEVAEDGQSASLHAHLEAMNQNILRLLQTELATKEQLIQDLKSEMEILKRSQEGQHCASSNFISQVGPNNVSFLENLIQVLKSNGEAVTNMDQPGENNLFLEATGLYGSGEVRDKNMVLLHPDTDVWISREAKTLAILKADGDPKRLATQLLYAMFKKENLGIYSVKGQRKSRPFPAKVANAIILFILSHCRKKENGDPPMTTSEFNKILNRRFGSARRFNKPQKPSVQ